MIDVHVLTHSGTRPEWLARCLASLRGEPCATHVVVGDEGHLGRGRARGFALGARPFVTFVDSDDYVLPGVMAACASELRQHRAVVTQEWIEAFGVRRKRPAQRHHLAVYRRDDVTPLLPEIAQRQYDPDRFLIETLAPVQLPIVGYVWTIHDGGLHREYARHLCRERTEK